MTAHELAHKLLAGPDLTVVVPGVASREGWHVPLEGVAVRRLWRHPDGAEAYASEPWGEAGESQDSVVVLDDAASLSILPD